MTRNHECFTPSSRLASQAMTRMAGIEVIRWADCVSRLLKSRRTARSRSGVSLSIPWLSTSATRATLLAEVRAV